MHRRNTRGWLEELCEAAEDVAALEVTDLMGLDVRLAIAEYLHRTLGGAHYAPPKILRDKVARGELGKKTGRGFYNWGAP